MLLHSCLYHVQRVHDQDLRHTSYRTSSELVYEGQGLFDRHGGGVDGGGRWGERVM